MKILILYSIATIISIIGTNNPNVVVYNLEIQVDSSKIEWGRIEREPNWKLKGDTFSINCLNER